jgi:hypothetical protein
MNKAIDELINILLILGVSIGIGFGTFEFADFLSGRIEPQEVEASQEKPLNEPTKGDEDLTPYKPCYDCPEQFLICTSQVCIGNDEKLFDWINPQEGII